MRAMRLEPRHAIRLLVAATFVLASIYSVVTPLFEASDELWHYPFIKRLADGQGMVEYDDWTHPAPWRQEAYQPPLYYFVGAAATFWIDTGDLPRVRALNPHADIGVPQPDGNVNMVVHDPAVESFPWQGTALAMHLVRLLSALMAAGTVYCAYRFALEVFPARHDLALAVAACAGFTPMFLFVGGVVNNDNAVILLSTLALWQLARLARPATPLRRRDWVVLGVTLGLALLSKNSALGLGGLAGLVTLYRAWLAHREGRALAVLRGGVLAAVLAVVIAGWWYVRNTLLYGDPTALAYFLNFVGRRVPTPTLLELWGERWGFMAAYWGFFGGVNVLMATWIYELLNTLAVVAALGAVAWLAAWLAGSRVSPQRRRDAEVHIENSASLRLRGEWTARPVRGFAAEPAPLLIAAAWPVIIVIGLVQWASSTLASQGRLTFPAIACFSLWLMLGLGAWLPRTAARLVWAAWGAGFFALALAAPFVWIAPAYAPPPQIDAAQLPAGVVRVDDVFDGQMRLLGYRLEDQQAPPGGTIALTLYWEVVAAPERDWSVFVHLLDANDAVVAQRDTYPGLGLFAASRLAPGRAWADRYVLHIPGTAYAPDDLRLEVGLYDLPSGARAHTAAGADSLRLDTVAIAARPGPIPNPLSVNFGDKIELAGYALDRRAAAPGETLRLTLYWRGRAPMDKNYTVFAHILGEHDALWGQKDSWPLNGAAPTSAWQVGALLEDPYDITVKPDAPPGVYPIEVGIYLSESPTFERLRVLAPDGRVVDDRVLLSKVRVYGK
jgi:4-amino-4-deoxy-L-arabinose transferase-like glycosyltransferase